jgi:hypothetical protein
LVGANTVKGAFARKRVDEIGGLHSGDQRRVVLRVDRILDDVLGGEHRGAAHHHRRLLGEGWHRGESSECKTGSNRAGESKFGELHVILLKCCELSLGGYGRSYGGKRAGGCRDAPHFAMTFS